MSDTHAPSTIDLLAGAVDAAREALLADVDAADIGEHVGSVDEGDGQVTHYFTCTRRSYRGWRWSVTLTCLIDGPLTTNEIVLIPGDGAIVAPTWVPYRDRIQPGDLSPGDLLPVADDDLRLVPTYAYGEDSLNDEERGQILAVASDLGLGRVRTLGREGLDLAAERWYGGVGGPESALAQSAPDSCQTCGFLVRLAGSLSGSFGVCANGNANDDGRVVAFDHGCGGHSEVRLAKRHEPQPLPEPAWDTLAEDLEYF
ncbi:MAG: DUF3027 domain-containing protein [Nocardioides sp.]